MVCASGVAWIVCGATGYVCVHVAHSVGRGAAAWVVALGSRRDLQRARNVVSCGVQLLL